MLLDLRGWQYDKNIGLSVGAGAMEEMLPMLKAPTKLEKWEEMPWVFLSFWPSLFYKCFPLAEPRPLWEPGKCSLQWSAQGMALRAERPRTSTSPINPFYWFCFSFLHSCFEFPSTVFFLINFYWSMVVLQCCVSLHCTTKWISHTHTDIPFPFRLPSHLGYHNALGRVPCAIQYVPISCLFYT